eukprot:s2845_g11.t1
MDVSVKLKELQSGVVTNGRKWLDDGLGKVNTDELRSLASLLSVSVAEGSKKNSLLPVCVEWLRTVLNEEVEVDEMVPVDLAQLRVVLAEQDLGQLQKVLAEVKSEKLRELASAAEAGEDKKAEDFGAKLKELRTVVAEKGRDGLLQVLETLKRDALRGLGIAARVDVQVPGTRTGKEEFFKVRSVFSPMSKVSKDTLRKLSNMNEDESNAFLLGLLGKCEKVARLNASGGIELNQVPVDTRKFNGPKDFHKSQSADAFFNHYYHNVAPGICILAPRSLFGLEPQLCDRTCAKENVVTGSGYAGLMGGNSALQPRHVHHMTMEAWYHIYVGWCDQGQVPEADRASNRTFRNVYDHTWKSALPMREISQHARLDGEFGFNAFVLQSPSWLPWSFHDS